MKCAAKWNCNKS